MTHTHTKRHTNAKRVGSSLEVSVRLPQFPRGSGNNAGSYGSGRIAELAVFFKRPHEPLGNLWFDSHAKGPGGHE